MLWHSCGNVKYIIAELYYEQLPTYNITDKMLNYVPENVLDFEGNEKSPNKKFKIKE